MIEGMGTHWFGQSWGAPVCEPGDHVKTPVGMICWGHEHMHDGRTVEILPSDQGVTIPSYHDGKVTRIAYHLDCWLHEIGADRA